MKKGNKDEKSVTSGTKPPDVINTKVEAYLVGDLHCQYPILKLQVYRDTILTRVSQLSESFFYRHVDV